MRARASMVTLLASMTLLAGCTGGGDDPGADPTPILPSSSPADPSPSESEAAEEEAPKMPEAAREDSVDGAREFMYYWTDVYNFATQTGDTEAFDRISTDNCQSCSGISEMVNDLYGEGGYVEAQDWEILQIGFAPNAGPKYPAVRFDRGRERVFKPGESKPEVFKAEDRTYTFQLQRSDDGWLVRELAEAS